MVSLTALWLPILLSAAAVFIASSIIHMLLPYHKRDYAKLPGEEKVLDVIREAGVGPGSYSFPCPSSPKEMRSPEMLAKYQKGPVGLLNVLPSGPPAMGKYLAMWLAYCLAIGFFVAYLTASTVAPGAAYLHVFRVAGTVGFLAYGAANVSDSIWKGQPWRRTLKDLFDALIYGTVTAGVFASLWPK
jgi:hypothetical protein